MVWTGRLRSRPTKEMSQLYTYTCNVVFQFLLLQVTQSFLIPQPPHQKLSVRTHFVLLFPSIMGFKILCVSGLENRSYPMIILLRVDPLK